MNLVLSHENDVYLDIFSIHNAVITSPTFTLSRRPVAYDTGGVVTISPCVPQGGSVSCPNSTNLLHDGVLGSGTVENLQTFSWNQNVDIHYEFPLSNLNHPRLVNLYFYNEPTASAPVVLPIIELGSEDIVLEYTILGNQDLSQRDSQYRSVSLAITTDYDDVTYDDFFVKFSFQRTNQWVVLSEIELCTKMGKI